MTLMNTLREEDRQLHLWLTRPTEVDDEGLQSVNKNNTAASEQRRFNVTAPCSPGAFLAKQFAPATFYITTMFDGSSGCPPIGQLHSDNLMQHIWFD